jgi:hypothetical protein
MVRYWGNWAVILGLSLGVMSGTARAQQAAVLSASISAAEPLVSAPDPIVTSPPRPLVRSNSSTIHIVPPVGAEQHVADRQFWTLVTLTAGTAVLDGETTIRGLETPGRREMNPLLGSHPDRPRFYATVGATDTAIAYVAYRLKRSGHEKLWKVPLVGASSIHLGGAINNLRY